MRIYFLISRSTVVVPPKPIKKVPKEPERPPWRASAAPPIKVDKSALLRARLLDASRFVKISFSVFSNRFKTLSQNNFHTDVR